MEIRTIDPKLDAESATARKDRITLSAFLIGQLRSLLGRDEQPRNVSLVYYPDYIAYTTVELHRYIRNDRIEKFLVGVDAVTGRVGEVDVDLPERRSVDVVPSDVIKPELSVADAEDEWQEWLFPYLDRRFRPIKRPDTALDKLELVFVPYWLIDYGTLNNSYVVSGLTKQIEEVTSITAIEDHYRDVEGKS
ncbi:hypothetical protein HAPAU_35440 [Halalkalicoccus paucihalophilus]|uniref:Uncharacterized protein n=1 Tax=Halalkalicoccus paucihalophilus TaxID=1008153 RepID=A0A151AA49_9EURY|nr:hypothetical protein [Halalkalicoccus paucihalophilus]KYH24561.1 hypothetical protein HAPAU_35440 [Halalkalicoccus paucihalophilus]